MGKNVIRFLTTFFKFPTQVDIYTDGSHKGKWGSWAFVVVRRGRIIFEASGRERRTTSHRMELQAAIQALAYLAKPSRVRIFSDSRILVDSMCKPEKKIPADADQLALLKKESSRHDVEWYWIKAHSGINFNERCDQLCIQARN